MLMMPAVVRPQYQTIISPGLSANNAGWGGFCFVSAFATGLLTKTGSRIRITMTPPSAGTSLVVASTYIGMAGTAPSFDGTQVQLATESSGATGFTLTAGGADVPCIANYRLTTSGTLLVAVGITSGDVREATGISANYTVYFKAADAANTGTTAKSGYTSSANRCGIVSKIEVLN